MNTMLGKRRGVSTILGTLIFVGILFSSIIPMLLVMNQADTVFEQTKHEISIDDDVRDRETLEIYSYPNGEDSEINVKIKNTCAVPVEIRRIWINDTYLVSNQTLNTMEEIEFGPYPVVTESGINSMFDVDVTTTRGNVYSSYSNPIVYDGTNGWVAEMLGIWVIIDSSSGGFLGFGKYRARVYNITETNENFDETGESDLQSGSATFMFDITTPGTGTYHVIIEKRRGFFWSYWWEVMKEEDVVMEWPSGPSVLWVYS